MSIFGHKNLVLQVHLNKVWNDFYFWMTAIGVVTMLYGFIEYLEKNLEAQSRRTEPALRRCRADKIARSIMAGKDRKTKSKNYV